MTPEQVALLDKRNARYAAKEETKQRRKEYYQRPEVRQKYAERNSTEKYKQYQKTYRESGRATEVNRARERRLKGFTQEMIDKLMVVQNGLCAVCGRDFSLIREGKGVKIHADHCHDTKAPRGLLCHHCNLAEGHIKKIGVKPSDFANRLEHYLESPPVLLLESGG